MPHFAGHPPFVPMATSRPPIGIGLVQPNAFHLGQYEPVHFAGLHRQTASQCLPTPLSKEQFYMKQRDLQRT
jgi:hypothetical protein